MLTAATQPRKSMHIKRNQGYHNISLSCGLNCYEKEMNDMISLKWCRNIPISILAETLKEKE